MSVAVHGLSKAFRVARDEEVTALSGVDLDAADGELVVVVGPSGSGKTTLLRCVAGLEDADTGRIDVGGRDVTHALPGDRDVAMVFQEYALFPHLDVADNIAFGLKARRTPSDEIGRLISSAAVMLSLGDVLHRRVSELSGGERQRVALARAVVREPRAFLMDEPLANLDAELRSKTRAEIRALQRRLGTTTLYVTHDQVEALTMGDRIAVMRDGRIEQIGAPGDVYDRPDTTFVAAFLGDPPMNLFAGDALSLDVPIVGIRPERIGLASDGRLAGKVEAIEVAGSHAVAHVVTAAGALLLRIDRDRAPPVGASVGLEFADSDLHRFDEQGARLG